jgi:hypothetical protein
MDVPPRSVEADLFARIVEAVTSSGFGVRDASSTELAKDMPVKNLDTFLCKLFGEIELREVPSCFGTRLWSVPVTKPVAGIHQPESRRNAA